MSYELNFAVLAWFDFYCGGGFMDNGMLQRCWNWDYCQRAIYMVTLIVAGRRPLLGVLVGGEADAAINKTAVGNMVAACWYDIPQYHPGVNILAGVVMPDHFHGVPFVTEKASYPAG